MSNNPLLPIFRLLPSRGLRYEPIRPLMALKTSPQPTSFARALQRALPLRHRPTTNQMSS
jgi:hypothetical protein